MIKILFIHHTAGWGGSVNSLILLINNLDHTKYDAEVLLLKNSDISPRLAENSIKCRIAESIFYRKYYQFFPHSEAGYIHFYQIFKFLKLGVLWLLSRYYYAGKELSIHEFNIVHLNSSVLTDWLAPARRRGKVIMHVREPFRKGRVDFLNPFFKSVIKKNANKIIAISKDNARRLGLLYKTEIIYNYSEIPPKKPQDSSYASGIVLYLGGSGSSKGFYTLVEAIDYLNKEVKIYFGGNYTINEKRNNLINFLKYYITNARKRERAIKKIKNHPNATFIGLIENIDYYMEAMSCLVSPFTVPHFSRPVIEAHLHRKPVIGTEVEGMEEIIEHDKNGLIIPGNNPGKLASAINDIVTDSKKARELGEAGYRTAIQKFTPGNIRYIENIYNELAS